jgi:hypothetical protein
MIKRLTRQLVRSTKISSPTQWIDELKLEIPKGQISQGNQLPIGSLLVPTEMGASPRKEDSPPVY